MKRITAISLLILALSAGLFAQPTNAEVITLTKAVDMALDRNFSVRQARNNVDAAQSGVMSAYGNFMPSLSFSSSWGGGQQYINGVAIGNVGDRNLSGSLSASVTVFDGFSNTASLTSAQATSMGSEYTLNRTRQSVTSTTERLYYEVFRTMRLLEIARLNVKYSTQQLDRVKETARLGSASLVNVYQQQAQVGSDEVRLVQSENDYALAKANLAAYLALDVTRDYEFSDASVPVEIDQADFQRVKQRTSDLRALVTQAMDRRFDYLSSLQSMDATDASVVSARSGFYPRVTASASYSINGRTRHDFVTNAVTASEFQDFGPNRSSSWGLSMSLPLFSGFRTSESVQRALVARRNAEEGLRDTERKIQVEVKTAVLQLEAAEKNYEAALKSLEYQDQNLKVNQEKYNVGSGTLLDLLFAQNNYTNALTIKINAVYAYLNAKSQLELAVGTVQQ